MGEYSFNFSCYSSDKTNIAPPEFAFMIGVSLALVINFKSVDEQMERLRAHAPNALMMAAVIIAAGMFLGVLNETGMLKAIATNLIKVIPAEVGPYLHIIVGLLGVPLDLLTSTDAYYFAVLPIVEQTAGQFGVPSVSTAYSMVIGNIIGTFVSPFSPALWLAIGLAEANMGTYIKYAFFGFGIRHRYVSNCNVDGHCDDLSMKIETIVPVQNEIIVA